MKKLQTGKMTYSPTDLTKYFESEFSSWMDHYYETSIKSGQLSDVHKNPPDPLQSILAEKGNIHEEEVLNKLLANDQVFKINRTEGTSASNLIAKTKEAMEAGASFIYQAALQGPTFFGYADLLKKVPGRSMLGAFHYEPLDMKIALTPKPTALLQLCAYAENLEHLQGCVPKNISVVTRDGQTHTYRTEQFYSFYMSFKKRFENFHKEFDPSNQPLPLKGEEHREWSIFAKRTLHNRDDIQLTAKIRQTHAEILRSKNITTLSQLASIDPQIGIKGIPLETLANLRAQADLQVRSPRGGRPLFEVLEHKDGVRTGLSMLPEANPRDIFFDMEGYPLLGVNGLEYLYGSAERGDGKSNYLEIWAKSVSAEASAFQQFMNFAFTRWKENPGMHIYHYGHYEPSTLKRLMGTYGVCENMMDELLRNEVFVDLYQVVLQALRVGTHSYGLKSIERLYYPERETDVGSGAESAVEFSKYLESGDERFLDRIRDYNKDDCFSTKDLEAFLRKLKDEKGIKYLPMQKVEAEQRTPDPDSIKEKCSKKAKELLSEIPPESRGLPLEKTEAGYYLQELIAHILEFHRREDNPDWWDYFRRRDLSSDQLFEDVSVLTGVHINRNNENGEMVCTFDSSQDTRFRVGEKVLILENEAPFENLEITQWDILRGTLVLSGKPSKVPSGSFTLAPAKSNIRKDSLLNSILEVANSFSLEKDFFGLRPAIHDLLLRKAPLINGKSTGGPLIEGKLDLADEVSNIVSQMNGGVLCIQGPPGAGKTYTGSKVIASLLKSGKKVAISSNSHKAINNLLQKVDEKCKADRTYSRPVKITSPERKNEESLDFANSEVPVKASSTSISVLFGDSKKPLYPEGPANLVGATAYYLCKVEHIDRFDYLFVDEATQVSLANLIGMARCARNIVLMGDQMQLDQPTQASHPGDSGNSALVHITNGKSIIDPAAGVFLPITYRMHPKITEMVSELFYEGKLASDPENERQKMIWSSKSRLQFPQSGITFEPVDHVGNTHGSEEEAARIKEIFEIALKSKWKDKNGKTAKLTPSDIVIVSPYNYQVSLIQEKLGNPEARVGSVDLFQGQEAPLVILSLCASSTKDAPRGISFLFNRNRINVALSRAMCLAIVVGSPRLASGKVATVEGMELLNVMCRITEGHT